MKFRRGHRDSTC